MQIIPSGAMLGAVLSLVMPDVVAMARPDTGSLSPAFMLDASDGVKSPGLPGDRTSATGLGATAKLGDADDEYPLEAHCGSPMTRVRASQAKNEERDTLRPGDCRSSFVRTAQAAQPGRGGDGAGFLGLPGGRGGEAGGPSRMRGGPGVDLPDDLSVDPTLVTYCIEVLQNRVRRSSNDYVPADCAYYFLALDRMAPAGRGHGAARPAAASGRDGSDGASVSGGVGGRGGQAGGGPGGGRGGVGGAGVGGGAGGSGGAGGDSD